MALRPPPASQQRSVLAGPLVLAATLFVATLCACIALVWLVDTSSDPGPWAVVLVVVAIAATIVSAYAESSWSARVTRTTELGNATRMFAVASVLLVIPTLLLQAVGDDEGTVDLDARSTEAACPEGRVPDVGFADLELGTTEQRLASCLRWWGVLGPEATAFGGSETVLRGQLATYLERLVLAAGAPLPEVPGVVAPDPASPDAGSIVRVSGAGILGAGDIAAFAPGDPVTREQLSAAIARAHLHAAGTPLPEAERAAFTDLEANPLAREIEAVAAAGIAVARDDEGRFNPTDLVNRTQVATVLGRTLDLWVTDGVTQPPA